MNALLTLLLLPLTDTISLVELLWTTIHIVGLIAAIWAISEASTDATALNEHKVNGRVLQVVRDRRSYERGFFLAQALGGLVGFGAMLNGPSPEPSPRGRAVSSAILILLLMGQGSTMAFISIRGSLRRKRIREYDAGVVTEADVVMTTQLDRMERKADDAAAHARDIAKNLAVAQRAVDGVAENLVSAQQAVDDVATDLDASHARADESEGMIPGEAADAAAKSPAPDEEGQR